MHIKVEEATSVMPNKVPKENYRIPTPKELQYVCIILRGQGIKLVHVVYLAFIPFLLFVFCWPLKLRKCLFTFFKSLACLALQTQSILKKIRQPKLPKTKFELTKICNEPGMKFKYFCL